MPELPESNLRDAAVMSKSKDPAPGTQAPAQANGSSEELKKGKHEQAEEPPQPPGTSEAAETEESKRAAASALVFRQ